MLSTSVRKGALLFSLLLIYIIVTVGCKKDGTGDHLPIVSASAINSDSAKVTGIPVLNSANNIILITNNEQSDVSLLNDSTLIINSLRYFTNAKGSDDTLTNVSEVKVGDIIVSDECPNLPKGLLVKVSAVKKEANQYTLQVSNQGIESLFDQVTIDIPFDLPSIEGGYPVLIPIGSTGAKLTLTPSYLIALSGNLSLTVQSKIVKTELLLQENSTIALGAKLAYQTNINLTPEPILLVKKILPTKRFYITIKKVKFPVVVTPVIKVLLTASLSGDMVLSTQVQSSNEGYIKVSTDGSKTTIDGDFSKFTQPTFTSASKVEGMFKSGIRTEADLNFYTVENANINAAINVNGILEGQCTDKGLVVDGKAQVEGTLGAKIGSIPGAFKIFKYPKDPKPLFTTVITDDPRFCTGDMENTTGTGGATGDVHVITLDQQYYNQQACGEFTALSSSYNNLLMQVRQGPRAGQTTKLVTFNRAIAIRYGLDTINFRINPLSLYVNGIKKDMSGVIPLSGNGFIGFEGNLITIQLATGDKVTIRYYSADYFDYTVALIEKHKHKVHGMLGNWNGNALDDVHLKNGTIINPQDFSVMYPAFPNSLRITQQQSLFLYDPGTSTVTYTDYSYPSDSLILSPQQTINAQTACINAGVTEQPALSNCTVDVGVTGDNQLTESGLFSQDNFKSGGLVVYLPFDGNGKDQSGWNNDANLYGTTTFTADRKGNPNAALSLNGSGFASIPNNPSIMDLSNTVTAAGWIKINQWYNGFGLFTCKSALGNQGTPLQIYLTSTGIGSGSSTIHYNFALNTWYHIAMVLENNVQTYYVNGVKVGSFSRSITTNSEPLDIGRDLYGAAEYLIGAVDDYHLYSRALSDAEIAQLAQP